MRLAALVLTSLTLALPAAAEPPRIVTDIPPVHSLTARVMDGIAAPTLLIPGTASPHDHALRPTDASALEQADALIWIGPSLTPWLEKAAGTLAGDAENLTLADLPGTTRLPAREEVFFDLTAHDHDHGHSHGHDHDHADGLDAHMWLDPDNARVWLGAIADLLARLDPVNEAAYRANAAAAQADIDTLTSDIAAQLAGMDPGFVVYHDAYQYFETRFGVPAAGALSLSDAAPPSARRLSELRARVEEAGIACILAEPQFDGDLIASVLGDTSETRVIDPLGARLDPGPALYVALIQGMADSIAGCARP
jgi:zinc transport system substrate-binding protein